MKNSFSDLREIDLSEIGFRAAFSVQDYTNKDIKLDPEFVKLAIHVTDNWAVV